MTKLLLVEDELLIAVLLKRNLQSAGYEMCELVGDGEEAIKQVEKEQPDFILMDIHLTGDMDGLETAREMQKRFDIPIIFMTGYSDKERIEQAKDLNPLAYLVKPVTPDHIIPIIDSALKKQK